MPATRVSENVHGLVSDAEWLDQVKSAAGWSLSERVLDGVLLTAPDGRVFAANPAACAILRRSEDEICRLGRAGLVVQGDPNLASSIDERRRSGAVVADLQLLRGDGEIAICEIASRIFAGPEGEELTTITLRDVTERRQLERQLAESEQRFRALASATTEAIGMHDGSRFLDANDAFVELFRLSREQLGELHIYEVVDPDFRDAASRFVASGDREPAELRLLRADGSSFWAEVRGRDVAFNGRPARVAAIRDVDARKQAERDRAELAERAADARRTRSLTIVAAGVAHELNNALQAALSASELIRERSRDSLELERLFDRFDQAMTEVRDLGNAMVDYAGRAAVRRAPVDLAELATNAAQHVSPTPKGQRVTVESDSRVVVSADGDAIAYVVRAMLDNAIEASPAGATIRIRVSRVRGDQVAAATLRPIDVILTGAYGCVEVADPGEGMDDETTRLMFDPFFSRRFLGRGLSLAASLGIVQQHDGAFSVRSSPGSGSTVAILLPLTAITARESKPAPAVAG